MKDEKFPYCTFSGAWAKIYILADGEGNVFYVGCTTKSMNIRLALHISESRLINKSLSASSNKRKIALIRSLDFKITATIVDMMWVTSHQSKDLVNKAKRLEKDWIKKYFDLGYSLVNGGQGISKKVKSKEFIGKVYQTNGLKILEEEAAPQSGIAKQNTNHSR